MFLNTWVISALAAVVVAVPTTRATNPNVFNAFSYHAGNDTVELKEINASGGSFYIGKATSTYCPTVQNLDCSKTGNSTAFVSSPSSGTLSMYVQVPGGQQVYIARDGSMRYTIVHSASIPEGASTSGFGYKPQPSWDEFGKLDFKDNGFAACPIPGGEGFYQLYALGAEGFQRRAPCVGMFIGTVGLDWAAVWEYA